MHKELLRILYLCNKGVTDKAAKAPKPDAFHHVKDFQEATRLTFQLLCRLNSRSDQACAVRLTDCLLRFALEDLKESASSEENKHLVCASWPQMLEYVHSNFTGDISRENVAGKFNLTPQYVSKLFHKNTGMTFKTYLTEERMKHAVELLQKTNSTVDEIAWECGYPYTSYFIKVFKERYKFSPGDFRRRKY